MPTNNTQRVIREAEEAQEPVIIADAEEVLRLGGLDDSAEEEVAAAEDEVAAIERSWRLHSEERTPLEHAVALSTVTMVEERARGTKQALQRLSRKQLTTDTGLIDLAGAPVFIAAMPGVTIHSTFAKVTAKPTPRELPVLILRQAKPAEYRPDGSVSGEFEVTYHHNPSVHRGLDARVIEDAAAESGIGVQLPSWIKRNDGIDSTVVKVLSATPATVVIPHIGRPETLGRSLAVSLAEHCGPGDQTITVSPRTGAVETRVLSAAPFGTGVEEEVDDEGQRTLTVTVSLVAVPAENASNRVAEAMSETLRELADGHLVSGLGRVSKVERIESTGDAAGQYSAATGNPINLNAPMHHWTVRITLDSSTGAVLEHAAA